LDIAAAKAFLNEDPPDQQLLPIGDLACPNLMPMDIDIDTHLSIPDVSELTLQALKVLLKNGKFQVSWQHSKIAASDCRKQICSAWLLIIAVHIRNVCITCQINLIYGNPCINIDYGHCSSCCHDTPPDPHCLTSSVAPLSDIQDKDIESAIEDGLDKILKWQQLTRKDLMLVTHQLIEAACHIWLSPPMHLEAGFLSFTCFLTKIDIKNIACDLHLVASKEALANQLCGW